MSDIQAAKKLQRAALRGGLAQLTATDIQDFSVRIIARIQALPQYAAAHSVLMFVPMANRPEVDFRPLIESALAAGKSVALPRTDWVTRTMTPRRITNLSTDLEPDAAAPAAAGLYHPRESCPRIDAAELELLLVPGLGFDLAGGRIGHGAGFYDRFLAQSSILGGRALVCGVGFEVQVLPPGQILPQDAHDRSLGVLITEARTLRFGGAAQAEPH